jgi:hypothetical protein
MWFMVAAISVCKTRDGRNPQRVNRTAQQFNSVAKRETAAIPEPFDLPPS